MLEAPPMRQPIRYLIEWIAVESPSLVFAIAPYALLGLVGLYILYILFGYLRVSQIGLPDRAQPVGAPMELSRAPDGALEAPAGYPYCPVDGLRYEPGTVFCARCEGDLVVDCANCRTTIRAADETCYRCGTHDTLADVSAH
jgi:hypothetical protein